MARTLTRDHHLPRVLVAWLVWAVIVPKVNDAIAYDPVVAGEQMTVTSDIAFTPAVGWKVTAGFRVGDEGGAPGVRRRGLHRGGFLARSRAGRTCPDDSFRCVTCASGDSRALTI